MADTFCNQCGHRNPPESNFCSSCGAPLDQFAADKPTIVFQVESGPDDEVSVELDELPAGSGMLMVKRGPNVGSKFTLDKDMVTVGRHPESDVFLDDITVSRRHVEVSRQAERYQVRDVGSLNGTYVNRERIEEATLANGDELQVGKFKLVFLAGPEGSE